VQLSEAFRALKVIENLDGFVLASSKVLRLVAAGIP